MGRACRIALLCAAFAVVSSTARADDNTKADALLDEGNQLGADGKYEQAIAKFRKADELVKRPLHACNMGLAYVRLTLWAEAHYYLARCKGTWSEGDLPSWVERRVAESERALKRGNYAKVSVVMKPARAKATVAPFPGEVLWSNSLWLPYGTHTVTGKAEGHGDVSVKVIIANRDDRSVSLTLPEQEKAVDKPPGADATPDGPTGSGADFMQTDASQPSGGSKGRGWLYAGIGTSVASVGLVALGFYSRSVAAESQEFIDELTVACDELTMGMGTCGEVRIGGQDYTQEDYLYEKDKIKTNNAAMVMFWSGAAVAAGLSTWFFIEAFSDDEPSGERPMVSAGVTPEGGQVSLGWTF